MTSTGFTNLGVVVIGRNEGDRLRRCLESIAGKVNQVVYVDSGSTDDSINFAQSINVEVVELDPSIPFTAARARNAGIDRLLELYQTIEFVQVVDGDCEVFDGWFERAIQEMKAHSTVAVVCGRRRERFPDASIYNRLCDMEWNTPIGEAKSCGGDSLMRVEAFKQVGGYDDSLIAGEEPELCFRLREAGWKVHRIDHDMTLHDAQMTRFGQWWKRMVRSGHAFAEGRTLHGKSPERFCVHQVRSIIEWTILLPAVTFLLAFFTWGLSIFMLAAYVVLWNRVRDHRLKHGDSSDDASQYALYCVIGKFAQLQGVVWYYVNHWLRRQPTIIEYKQKTNLVEATKA